MKNPDEGMYFNMHPAKLKYLGVPVEWHQEFVCFLSRRWNSNLLWSHYAAGHTGIAIRIDTLSLSPNIEIIDLR